MKLSYKITLFLALLILTLLSLNKEVPSLNAYLQCDSLVDKTTRFTCYKTVTLEAISRGQKIDDLLLLSQTLKSPHLLEHSIGTALLVTSDYNLEKARQKCAPNCLDSYYHAFAEEWANHAPTKVTDFETFITKYCPLDEDAKVGCYHNLGHFYEASTKILNQSLSLCNQYQPEDKFTHCAYGAIHEHFILSGTDNYFSNCAKYSDRTKTVCFTIGSRLLPQWLSDTIQDDNPLKICNDLYPFIPREYNHCYRSLSWVMQDINKNPKISLCNQENSEQRTFCQKGLTAPEGFWDILGCSLTDENGKESSSCAIDSHP